MDKQPHPESRPRKILGRVGLALGALTLGFMVTPEGPLQAGTIWVDGYDTPVEGRAETTDHLTIATYNVKNGHIDREGVVETVRAIDADVVGLNEVSPALAMELAAGGRYNYRFGETLQTGNGPYGNALLVSSDYDIVSYQNIMLPDRGLEPRAALHVQVDTGDETLNIFVTHLTPGEWGNSRSSLRYDQANVLMSAVEAYGPENAMVLGDLNEESGRAYDLIAHSLSDGINDVGLQASTFSNGYNSRQYDHILLNPDTFEPVGGGTSGSGASDHEILGIELVMPG